MVQHLALHDDNTITSWGDSNFGGDSSTVQSIIDGSIEVSTIVSNESGFAALLDNGKVEFWK